MRAKVGVSLSELRALYAGLAFLLAVCPANADGIGAAGFGQLGKHGLAAASGPPPPPPTMFIPVMANLVLPSSGTNQQYGATIGIWGSGQLNTSATARQVPLAIGGVLSGLNANLPFTQNTSPTPAAVVANINAVDATVTCQFTAAAAPFNCSDSTHVDSVNAGDLFNWHFTAGTGPWAQAGATGQISFLFQSSDNEGMTIAGPGGIAGTVVSSYFGFGTGANTTNGSEALISSLMPISGTVNGLYVIPNGSDNLSGVTHSYTLVKNGTNTAMTCSNPTPTVNPNAGCCVDVTAGHHIGGPSGPACGSTSTVAFAVGDTLSVLASCPGANCSTTTPAMSISYTPTTAGQTILTAYFTAAPSTTTYVGPYDNHGVINNQFNYGIMPILGSRLATFSNLIACSTTVLTGANTRTVTSQFGTAVNVLPTNAAGGPVASWGLGVACPGANSIPSFGAIDTVHTFNAGSGYTLDNAMTVSVNGQAGNSKVSYTAVIH